jgi:hypothetical protein
MADIFERLVKNYGPIGQHRERAHGYFAFPKLEGEIGSRMKFRGKGCDCMEPEQLFRTCQSPGST